MEFISTKGMTCDTAPEGQVLVQYLEPSWGGWSIEFAVGYFDNPNDYAGVAGDGWKLWSTSSNIKVLAYAPLPEKVKSDIAKTTQKEFLEKFGTFHPDFGCVGE